MSTLVTAAIILVVVLIIAYLAGWGPFGDGDDDGAGREGFGAPMLHREDYFYEDMAAGYPYNFSVGAEDETLARNRYYSTAEVDPVVTGQLFAGPRAGGPGRRLIYGGRTSHSGKQGMAEFEGGVPGEPGVDVGLLGMREYSLTGKPDVFDDGIPENWKMPSTPISWYAPAMRDHYDFEQGGPAVYAPGLVSLREPDHEPLIGPTSWPDRWPGTVEDRKHKGPN